jgi:Rrf2 family nitric oxide-sensitive transcriptional repressor
VMQQMAQKGGYLKSEYGVNGGYHITKNLSEISIHDLIELVEGPTAVVKCLHKENPCEIKGTCNIVSPLTELNQRLTRFYQSLNLQELLIEPKTLSRSQEAVIDGQ